MIPRRAARYKCVASVHRKKALQALVSDEQIASLEEAEKILAALVKAQGERLARFRG